MDDAKSTQYLLKLLQTKCRIIREWADKLRLKLDVRQNTMLNIIVSQADQIIDIANDYSKGNLFPETEESIEPEPPVPSAMNNPEVNSILGEWKMEKEPEDDNHFGEEQTEGLADLLAGLKDSPHDDRW